MDSTQSYPDHLELLGPAADPKGQRLPAKDHMVT